MQPDGVFTGRGRRIRCVKIQQDPPHLLRQRPVSGQLRGPRQRHQKIHPVDPAAFFDGAPPFEFQKIDLLQRTEIIQRAVFRNRFGDPAVIHRTDDLLLDETAAAVKRIQFEKVIAVQQFAGQRRIKAFNSVHDGISPFLPFFQKVIYSIRGKIPFCKPKNKEIPGQCESRTMTRDHRYPAALSSLSHDSS